jgi:hypothetical protein
MYTRKWQLTIYHKKHKHIYIYWFFSYAASGLYTFKDDKDDKDDKDAFVKCSPTRFCDKTNAWFIFKPIVNKTTRS